MKTKVKVDFLPTATEPMVRLATPEGRVRFSLTVEETKRLISDLSDILTTANQR